MNKLNNSLLGDARSCVPHICHPPPPMAGPILTPEHQMKKLGRCPLEDARCQISKLHPLVLPKRNFKD